MRRAAKIDANQKRIVETLRGAGCLVKSTAAVGDGFPDLLVCRSGDLRLMEVKNPETWRGRLTADQQKFHGEGWPVSIVTDEYEALHAMGFRRG